MAKPATAEVIRVVAFLVFSGLPADVNNWKPPAININNKKITVVIGLNYGGRDEILRAIKKIQNLELRTENLGEENFSQYLDTAGIPDPDLIIRTGGAMRLSGFLPWQSQYSELYFTKTLMPDFTIKEFEKALKEYRQRQRRFGK